MSEKKKNVGPFRFLSQVRSEGNKVTWTSQKETFAATIMVLIMVTIMAIFLSIADFLIRLGVRFITGVE